MRSIYGAAAVMMLLAGATAHWLSAADTAHEDAIMGEGGSFRLILANHLFMRPLYYLSTFGNRANWDASFAAAYDSFQFDPGQHQMLWQHGHATSAHLLQVRKLVNGKTVDLKSVLVNDAKPMGLHAQPGATIDIFLTTPRAGNLPNVRIVMAKTGPLHRDAANCGPAGVPAAPASPKGLPRRPKPCIDGHNAPGLTSEDLDYSWVIMSDKVLTPSDSNWQPPTKSLRNGRLFVYSNSPEVKPARIKVTPRPEKTEDFRLDDAQCSYFQICENVAKDNGRVPQCRPMPAILPGPGSTCRFLSVVDRDKSNQSGTGLVLQK